MIKGNTELYKRLMLHTTFLRLDAGNGMEAKEMATVE